jgi:hypothetical protein
MKKTCGRLELHALIVRLALWMAIPLLGFGLEVMTIMKDFLIEQLKTVSGKVNRIRLETLG